MGDKLYSTSEDEQMSRVPAYTPDRATQTLREYDERMGTRVPVSREATQTPSSMATQGMLEGLSRDRQAAQEKAAISGEIRGELGSTMTRFVNEPVLETMRATPIVNYLAPSYTPSSSTPYSQNAGSSNWTQTVNVEGAGVTGAPTQPKDTIADEAMRQYMALQAGGYRAAPGVSMNADMRRGLAGQQEAMRGVMSAMEAEQPGQAAERAAILSEGEKYARGLEQLRAQQQGVFAQRRERMAQDEAAMAQAREQFDPSRVLRQVASSPVSSGALSFAAGLVGMLRGSAGDINSNVVLQEVDKAVERDTQAQLQKYQMLKDGIATGTSNFADMVRMGASEQEALGLTAAASLENHKRALEFAAQRISGAKEKAAVKEAISAIDFQRGKLQLDIDMKNASNWIAMNRARDERALRLLELARKSTANPDVIKAYESLTGNDRFIGARQGLEAVANIRSIQQKIDPQRQKAIWDTSIGRLLNEALTEKTAQAADKGEVVLGAISKFINSKVAEKRFESPEEQQMVNMVQKLINTNLRQMSGGSVTSGEAMRDYLSRNLSSYENFSNWMDAEENLARNNLRQYKIAASADPALKSLMDATLLPGEAPLQEYHGRQAVTTEAAGASKK